LPEATGELWVPIESLVGLDVKGGERAEWLCTLLNRARTHRR